MQHAFSAMPVPGQTDTNKSTMMHMTRRTMGQPKVAGAAAMARAAYRYGFKAAGKTNMYYTPDGRPGSTVMRKSNPTTEAGAVKVQAEQMQADGLFSVPVKIGTPGVVLRMDVDTGSADMWLWSNKLADIRAESNKHAVYDPERSSTQKKLDGHWQVNYDDGSYASGKCCEDTARFGNIEVKHCPLELATRLSKSFQHTEADGSAGFGFPALNMVEPKRVKTPMEMMMSEHLLTKPLLTVRMTNENSGKDSFYTLGHLDTTLKLKSDLTWENVDSSKGRWDFDSPCYTLNGEQRPMTGMRATADTGSPLTMLPEQMCAAIYGAIDGARFDNDLGAWIMPQQFEAPRVELAVGSKMFALTKENLDFGDAGNQMRYGGVQSLGNDTSRAIFGCMFMLNRYCCFDYAEKKFGCADVDQSA